MIYIKFHKGRLSEVVSVCDKDLIGKNFSTKKLCLNIKKDFYKGELMEEKEIKKILKSASNLNIVGERSIKLALKEKIIDKDNIIRIKGVPHAQIYSV